MQEVAESGHPDFRGTSPKYPKEHLKSKRGGESSVHCNEEPPTAELLLMHIIAVNQHGVHVVQQEESATSSRTSNGRRRRTRGITTACNSPNNERNSGELGTGRPDA